MKTFLHTVRVPYAHTDQMGFVYYANYFVYFEMARAELLREVGFPYTEMEKRGVMLPVLEASCHYKKAGHFDDLLTIKTGDIQWRGPRLSLNYVITRDEDVIVTGHTVHACMSPQGRIIRPTQELRSLFDR